MRPGFAPFPAVLVGALLMAGQAAAQTLPIDGPYGNESGCALEAGQVSEDDSVFVLRPDGLEAYAGICEFVQVLPARSGASVATALCEGEGMYDVRMFAISQPDPENDSLLVFWDGQLWHEVRPCE